MNLEVFRSKDFGEVRVALINNIEYFVAKDVALMLGYANTNKAIGDHCKKP